MPGRQALDKGCWSRRMSPKSLHVLRHFGTRHASHIRLILHGRSKTYINCQNYRCDINNLFYLLFALA